jgi:hypothetical protein
VLVHALSFRLLNLENRVCRKLKVANELSINRVDDIYETKVLAQNEVVGLIRQKSHVVDSLSHLQMSSWLQTHVWQVNNVKMSTVASQVRLVRLVVREAGEHTELISVDLYL